MLYNRLYSPQIIENTPLSYIDNIRIFVRAVEVGNLSAAGRDLRVSPAVASNRIKELEKHLGVRLFNRTTRQLNATEQGRIFYDGAKRILDAIAETEAAVAEFSQNPKGHILVSAPMGFGKQILAPIIPEFHEAFPDIQIRFRLSDRRVDVIKEGIDLAFHMGDLPDSNLKMHQIAMAERVLCAAPQYLKARGAPKDLMDLKHHHDCLLLRFPGSREYYWSFDDGEQKVNRVEVSGPFDTDQGAVLTQWALDGHGVVNKALFEIKPYLDSGALVRVLPDETPVAANLAVLYPHRRFQEPKIRVFLDYVIPRCRARLEQALS